MDSTATKANWQRCVAFHGHACPGLAIGVRACEAAARELGIHFARDEEVVCVTENDACGVDAVQVLTGCSMGKGNLIARITGKMAFSFFCRGAGRGVRVVFKQPIGPTEEVDRETRQLAILDAPLDELFDIKEPTCIPSIRARLFDVVTCEQCGERCAEFAARIQGGKKVCLDCFIIYDRGW